MTSIGGGYGALPASVLLRQEPTRPAIPSGPTQGLTSELGGTVSPPTQTVAGPSFEARVAEFLDNASGMENQANAAAEGLVRGDHHDVHGTMIAMQEADVSFRLVTSVRNRVVEAYREIMRMGA